ncbi:hypothetical protein [Nonomuraea jabiensis]|uniref:hypothetical protein n=1 Tax=Nonomuraea jabiensis TaxID=882448 RepID=UPI003D7432FC
MISSAKAGADFSNPDHLHEEHASLAAAHPHAATSGLRSYWVHGRGTAVERAMTEGLNGRLKGHDLDVSDPKNRLAHGRVAQTILVALLVTVANDHFLDAWRHTHQPPDEPDTSAETFEIPAERLDRSPLTGRNRPPPIP